MTLLGASGSGKTTLLRLIAGFERPTSGELWMGGKRLDTLPAHQRPVNTVFQQYALFPHLSVRENVAYGLRVRKVRGEEITERVGAALEMVKMGEFGEARPGKLSGGQQQRVALARALVNRPRLLLLDEPLSALDANLRKTMQRELKALQREIGITFLFVTHDQEEAMALSDRIALLRDGGLEQIASPREIYAHPSTSYAAEFIGHTNLLEAEILDGWATCGTMRWPTAAAPGRQLFSLRPEAIGLAVSAETRGLVEQFRGVIRGQVYNGANEVLEVDCGLAQTLRVRIPASEPLTGEHTFEFAAASAVPLGR